MIDLSHQPDDEGVAEAGSHPDASLEVVPQHDRIDGQDDRSWTLTHDRAEAAVEVFSRWAGPVILLATITALSWYLLG